MAEQPANLVVAVLDSDVVAVVHERGLEKWARHPADIQLYQRDLLPEIMAGNYMVRNTPTARSFLRTWADYNKVKPSGFSSSDNGAIHLVVQKLSGVAGYDECYGLYRGLNSGGQDMDAYFNFTNCALKHIGEPRDWNLKSGGTLSVWRRFNYWAADGVYLNKVGNKEMGPLLFHGVKDAKDVADLYYNDINTCTRNAKAMQSTPSMKQQARRLVQGYPAFFPAGGECKGSPHATCHCMNQLNCWPLLPTEEPMPEMAETM